MSFGTLLRILLRLALSLSIFIIPLGLSFQGEYGTVVLTSMQQRRMHSCCSFCGPVGYPELSDIRVFRTLIQIFSRL